MPTDPSNDGLGAAAPGSRATDEQLLSAFVGGEEAMFEELLQRHEAPLYGFIYRQTGSHAATPDLFQETLVRVFRHAASFDGRSSFKTWLYAIACNVCRSYGRKLRSAPPMTSELPDDQPGRSPDPSDAAASAEMGRLVAQAIDTLPETQREVLVMRVYDRMSYREIAEAVNRPEATVKSQMRLAIGRLRNELQGVEEPRL